MIELFSCTINGRPIVKKNTQKIVRRYGTTVAIYTPQFLEWQKSAMVSLKQANMSREMITVPIEARFKFYFKNRSGEADLSNLIEAPQDVMKKAGVIEDDRLIQVIHATKHFGHEPRVEIELYALEASA